MGSLPKNLAYFGVLNELCLRDYPDMEKLRKSMPLPQLFY